MKQELKSLIATAERYRKEYFEAYNEATQARNATGAEEQRLGLLFDEHPLDRDIEADYEQAANTHFEAAKKEWEAQDRYAIITEAIVSLIEVYESFDKLGL